MTGIALHADFDGLKHMAAVLNRYQGFDRRPLLDAIGGAAVDQTQYRIQVEKASPEGEAWKPWSERYKERNLKQNPSRSLLIAENHLLSGMTHNVLSESSVEWGSPEIYAGVQQGGNPDMNIPARPYLGFSPANVSEIEKITADYLENLAPRRLA